MVKAVETSDAKLNAEASTTAPKATPTAQAAPEKDLMGTVADTAMELIPGVKSYKCIQEGKYAEAALWGALDAITVASFIVPPAGAGVAAAVAGLKIGSTAARAAPVAAKVAPVASKAAKPLASAASKVATPVAAMGNEAAKKILAKGVAAGAMMSSYLPMLAGRAGGGSALGLSGRGGWFSSLMKDIVGDISGKGGASLDTGKSAFGAVKDMAGNVSNSAGKITGAVNRLNPSKIAADVATTIGSRSETLASKAGALNTEATSAVVHTVDNVRKVGTHINAVVSNVLPPNPTGRGNYRTAGMTPDIAAAPKAASLPQAPTPKADLKTKLANRATHKVRGGVRSGIDKFGSPFPDKPSPFA